MFRLRGGGAIRTCANGGPGACRDSDRKKEWIRAPRRIRTQRLRSMWITGGGGSSVLHSERETAAQTCHRYRDPIQPSALRHVPTGDSTRSALASPQSNGVAHSTGRRNLLRFFQRARGSGMRVRPVSMDFNYGSSFGERTPDRLRNAVG